MKLNDMIRTHHADEEYEAIMVQDPAGNVDEYSDLEEVIQFMDGDLEVVDTEVNDDEPYTLEIVLAYPDPDDAPMERDSYRSLCLCAADFH